MNKEELKRLHRVHRDILDYFDKFCKDNNIQYTLYGGTLLGAIRHEGPIPWDDDVDVAMTRDNYDKFLKIWENNDKYYLQLPTYGTHINHTKLRKNHTVLASESEYKHNKHNGIWLDIFSFEKIPTNKFLKYKYLISSVFRIIYTRDYPYVKGNRVLYYLSKILLLFPKKLKISIVKKTEANLTKYKNLNKDYLYISPYSPIALKRLYDPDFFKSFINTNYDGLILPITSMFDEMLIKHYGDYMSLPPVEERVCTHNPTHFSTSC